MKAKIKKHASVKKKHSTEVDRGLGGSRKFFVVFCFVVFGMTET